MRAFVCVGLAIILTFIILGAYAEHCLECCNGEPCNPELRAKVLKDKLGF
jgi:hypothetical protein